MKKLVTVAAVMAALMAPGLVCGGILTGGGVPDPNYQVGGTNVMRLWLKADAINTNAGSGEGRIAGGTTFVTNWLDQSSWTNDATQETDANQPYYVANALGTHPAVRFTVGSLTHLKADAVAPYVDEQITVFLVARVVNIPTEAPWGGIVLAAADTGSAARNEVCWPSFWLSPTPMYWGIVGNVEANGSVNFIGHHITTANWHNAFFAWDTVTDEAAAGVDGAIVTTTGTIDPAAVAMNRFTIGARRHNSDVLDLGFDGYVVEVIVYSAPLTYTEINEVGHYLQNKYDLDGIYIPSEVSPSEKLMVGRQPNPYYRVNGELSMLLWLAADAIDTNDATQVSGGSVKKWLDQSRAGGWAVPDSSSAPLYVDSVQNGKPVVRFNGEDQWLAVDCVAQCIEDRFTAFLVFRPDDLMAQPFGAGHSVAEPRHEFIAGASWLADRQCFNTHDDGPNQFITTGAVAVASTWYNDLYEWNTDANTVKIGQNGAFITRVSGTPIGATTLSKFTVGAIRYHDPTAWFLDGDIAELILYRDALSSNEINEVGYYLQDKYGLTGGYIQPYADGTMFLIR